MQVPGIWEKRSAFRQLGA